MNLDWIKVRIKQFLNKNIKRKVASPKGERMLTYCGEIIKSNGAYEPVTMEEMVFENALKEMCHLEENEEFTSEKRVSIAGKVYVTLLSYVDLRSYGEH